MQIFKFNSIYKQTVWGGTKLALLKQIDNFENLGETWEISSINDNLSVVSNGKNAGLTIKDIIEKYKELLLGKNNYKIFGTDFPLLIKFIDAEKDLSIQVHPNEDMAQYLENSHGKTEMWYVVDCEKKSDIIIGTKPNTNAKILLKSLKDDSVISVLNTYQISKGDSFYIPSGVIHAIKRGTLIAEIQQTSDVTYRLYDYLRKDKNNKFRDLHIDKAIKVIDFSIDSEQLKVNYNNCQSDSCDNLISCEFFKTRILQVSSRIEIDYRAIDSFIIYMNVSGSSSIVDDFGNSIELGKCETILLSAQTNIVNISGNAKIIEITI